MNAASLELLSTVAQDVLRSAAFAFGDACSADALPLDGSQVILARLRIRGFISGELRLAAPADVCTELAADALAEDVDEIGIEQAEDSLKELLNVIGGNWLTAVYGDEPVFALSAPEAEAIVPADWERLCRDAGSVGLLIGERPLLVNALFADQGAPS